MVSIKNINKGLVIVIVLTVVFYAGFLIYGDLDSIGNLFLQINLWFIPLILAFRLISILLRSIRQKVFLQSLDVEIPTKFNTLLYISGLSMLVTPGSSGTMIKSYILNKKFGTEHSKTIPVVITEKFHDLLVPFLLIAAALYFINISKEIQFTAILASAIMILLYFIFTRKQKLLQKLIGKTSKIKLLNKFQKNLLDNYDSFNILSKKKPFILGFALGLIAIFVDGIAIYFGFLALGIDFDYLHSLVTVYTANILGLISFMPAGFGVVEISLLGLLSQSGFVLSVASSMVVITRLSSAWFQIILGFVVQFYLLKKIPN